MTHRITTDNKFAAVPNWVIESGISPQAGWLYVWLKKYADYGTGDSFPSRRTLAGHLGLSKPASVDRYITELVQVGALTVIPFFDESRNNRQSSNTYTVVTTPPRQPETPRPPVPSKGRGQSRKRDTFNEEPSAPRTTICYDDPAGSSPDPCATTGQAPSRNSPEPKRDKWGVLESDRRPVRDAIMATARQEYRTDAYWDAFQVFRTRLSEVYGEDLAGYVDNKVSIHESAATPKGAGTKLNTIIATAIRQDNVPAPAPAR